MAAQVRNKFAGKYAVSITITGTNIAVRLS